MINELIHKFLNRNTKQEVPENEYDPTPKLRIKKTVRPDKVYTFNEVYLNAYQNLKK